MARKLKEEYEKWGLVTKKNTYVWEKEKKF